MIIDGKKIAEDLKTSFLKEVSLLEKVPILAIVSAGANSASEQFVRIKKEFAEGIGVDVHETVFMKDITTEVLVGVVGQLSEREDIGGIVVQLPLPKHIDRQLVLDAVSVKKDVDLLATLAFQEFKQGKLNILPPVIGAINEILERESVSLKDKKAVVLGKGILVGLPAIAWLKQKGVEVKVLDRSISDISVYTKEADILVLGAGSPYLIKPEMIKEGTALFDAGASELTEKIVGDADPACAEKCSIFTPVPGGIGPITVAMIFKNLLELNKILK